MAVSLIGVVSTMTLSTGIIESTIAESVIFSVLLFELQLTRAIPAMVV